MSSSSCDTSQIAHELRMSNPRRYPANETIDLYRECPSRAVIIRVTLSTDSRDGGGIKNSNSHRDHNRKRDSNCNRNRDNTR